MSLDFERLKTLKSGSGCLSGLLHDMLIALFVTYQLYARYLICPIIIYRKAYVK